MKQKTRINRDIRKIYYKTEINQEELNKYDKEYKTFERAISYWKKIIRKTFDDISLKKLEMKIPTSHYKLI